MARMSEPHGCLELAKTSNVIFYSTLWKSWALKVFPANYDRIPEAMKNYAVLQPVMITIKFCPYCGEELR